MAVSRRSGQHSSRNTLCRLFEGVSRYDLTLALLPLGFVLSLLGYVLVAVPLWIAILGGSLFGLLVLVDALFVHPPSERPPRTPR